MISPPAFATLDTCSELVTVPAPITQFFPNAWLRFFMLSSGSGEFNGTSIIPIPLLYIASPISIASSGLTPRSIATIGIFF